ncbi:MAG: nitroreductase family protein [Jatrophihabitans sp.]
MPRTESGPVPLDPAAAEAAVEVAVRAPSIHNTQPWSWRLDPDGLVLRADRTRQLAVADPDGHSLMLSCGAAMLLTETALHAQGWQLETTVLPDRDDPDLLARFRPMGRGEPDALAVTAVQAAKRRRSDRRPFAAHPVPPELAEELQAAGSDASARVHFPTQEDEQINLAVAVSRADRVERHDQAYLDEMNHWLHDPDVHAMVDGIPTAAIPHVPHDAPRRSNVPLRDFEVGVTGKLLIDRDVDEKPLIGVVLTDFDHPRDQLHAGACLMRFMIAAELRGMTTCLLSQAVDFPAFRARFQEFMGWVGHPQIMVRVGYPSGPADQLVRTPRRGAAAVLTLAV